MIETLLSHADEWLPLPFEEWRPTKDTLHMCLQVIGKIRLALCPFEPEWGNVPLYVTARGLATSPIPWDHGTFEILVDFLDHEVAIETSQGRRRSFPLQSRPVAEFYRELMESLASVGVKVQISTKPTEVPSPIPFPEDTVHHTYVRAQAQRFWTVLSGVDMVFRHHRARFRGRTTPTQFFWGTFDLALIRYSGKSAEPPAGSNVIYRVGADAEQISAGFWPGDDRFPAPAFFSYAYPKPDGLEKAPVGPTGAFWHKEMGEFLLPYEVAQRSASPARAILEFLETTYLASATLMGWDRALIDVPERI